MVVIKFILKRAFRSLLTKDVIFSVKAFSHSASVLPLLSRKYHSMIILVAAAGCFCCCNYFSLLSAFIQAIKPNAITGSKL
jgi:hypothetical protein